MKIKHLILLILIPFINYCVTDSREADQLEKLLISQIDLAKQQLNAGAPGRAIATIRPAWQKFPNDYRVATIYGLVQLALGNSVEAAKILSKACSERPSAQCSLNLSSALIRSGKVNRARKIIRNALRKFPKYDYPERLWHNLGLSYEYEKKRKAALRFYNRSLKINPTYYLSLVQKAKIMHNDGKRKQADFNFHRAAQFCPTCFEPIKFLAASELAKGHKGKAMKRINNFLGEKGISKKDRRQAILMKKEIRQFKIQ